MAARNKLPLPSPTMLRKQHAAQYLGMSVDMFEKNIRDGYIENGSKLLPSSKNSKILGWSIEKLDKARIRLDNATSETNEDVQFENALMNFEREMNTNVRN